MKALILVDVQNDFMPGGALAVPRGDEIIPLINELTQEFRHVIATQDWHPENHVSFAPTHDKRVGDLILADGIEQALWPIHCVQESAGAKFAKGLNTKSLGAIFHKGTDPKVDSYSTFFDNAKRRSTGLEDHLRKHEITELYFTGLATDYCVLYSVLDALSLGFQVTVIRNACKAIGDEEEAFQKMRAAGATISFLSSLHFPLPRIPDIF